MISLSSFSVPTLHQVVVTMTTLWLLLPTYFALHKRLLEGMRKIGRASCRERVCLYV